MLAFWRNKPTVRGRIQTRQVLAERTQFRVGKHFGRTNRNGTGHRFWQNEPNCAHASHPP
jgi:hypothetical protein